VRRGVSHEWLCATRERAMANFKRQWKSQRSDLSKCKRDDPAHGCQSQAESISLPCLGPLKKALTNFCFGRSGFSSGLKDSHVSSNTVCKSWSVSGVKAFIIQTLTKPPSGWGRARRLRTPEIKQRGTPPPDFTLFPRVNVAIKRAN
jgi:hypothetical protein